MPKKILIFFFFSVLINMYNSQINDSNEELNKLRSLSPSPSLNISEKDASQLRFHYKLSQTVYSDIPSQHLYFTTLYITENKRKQRYLIDTTSDIMSSTCNPEPGLNPQKTNYIFYSNKTLPQLKCDSKVCNLLPANICHSDKKSEKEKDENLCSYDSINDNNNSSNGIKGYYVQDIAYLEEDVDLLTPLQRKKYHSYAIPIGCTTEETGKYKDLMIDGILGVNRSPKSFIGLLYKLKIIKKDLFSLCFAPRGGFMSLGEIDHRHHLERDINYVPLVDSDNLYQIKVNSISVGNDTNNIETNTIAQINTGSNTTYFPEQIYEKLIKKFDEYCSSKENCGKFENNNEFGICASFTERESLFNAIYRNWPEITIHLENNYTYTWKPFNYYVYHHINEPRLACLSFGKHNSQEIILGTYFFHGYDIIFDRGEKQLGFVKADCSRGNHLWRRSNFNRFYDRNNIEERETVRKYYGFRYNRSEDAIDFIRGTNNELNFGRKFKFVNYILLSGSIIILVIVAISVISLLIRNKKAGLRYYEPDVVIDQESDSNRRDDNYD